MNNIKLMAILFFAISIFTACGSDPAPILGCTDPDSLNFNREADTDDGNCSYLRDKVAGDWEATSWVIEGTDLIRENWELEFEFEDNGDFDFTVDAPDITPIRGKGEWELKNDEELVLEYDDSGINWLIVDILYDQGVRNEEEFEATFNSTHTEIEMETLLSGFSVDIILKK